MPRKARLDKQGALQHIMVRGINKTAIFGDDHDRQKFLERLSLNLMDSDCYVLCLGSYSINNKIMLKMENFYVWFMRSLKLNILGSNVLFPG
jgi:hypothetical protein